MKKRLLLAVFLAILPITSVFAINVVALYQAEIPVSSQSDEERAIAVRQGFSQMLLKLTGDPDVEKNPDIKAAVRRADYYVQEYSYSLPTPSSATYMLNIVFESTDVKRLLRKSGVAFWGEKRPLILVWLAVTDDKHTTAIIGSETPGDILDAINEQSQKFALPLIFPMMDVADMSQVSTEEVVSMAIPALKQAGKRYAPNAYLVGKVETTVDGYQSDWQLIFNQDQWTWSVTDKSMDGIISEALYQTSQALSKYYRART